MILNLLNILYFTSFILVGLIYSMIHSKRYGITITTFNIKVLFTLVSLFLIYSQSLYSLNIITYVYITLIVLTVIILWIINLQKIDETFYYILSLWSSLILISCYNLFYIYLFLEISAFTYMLMISMGSDDKLPLNESSIRMETSTNYFILSSLFSCILLLGIYFLYIITGETSLIHISLLSHYIIDNDNLYFNYKIASTLIIISLFFKLGSAPFSLWVPTTYYGASSKVSIFLSTFAKLPILYLLYITIYYLNDFSLSNTLLAISIVLSLIIGVYGSLNVNNLKSLIAYSSINSLGFILIPYLNYIDYNITLISFYVMIYMLSIIFLWIYIISTNTFNINNLKYIFKINPLIAYSILIILFSLAGIPPFIGFFPKLNIFIYSIYMDYYLIGIISILVSILAAFYYIRLIVITFFSKTNNRIDYISLLTYNRISYINSYILGIITYISTFGFIIYMFI